MMGANASAARPKRRPVVVVGAVGRLAEMVVTDLGADRAVCSVPSAEMVRADVDGSIDLILIGGTGKRDVDGSGIGLVDLDTITATLHALPRATVTTAVVLSSALVYDSCRDQPLPIDESAIPAGGHRGAPEPNEPAIASRLAAERAAAEWCQPSGSAVGDESRRVRLVILRPVICGGTAARPWFSRSLFAQRRVVTQHAAPLQMVHLDDAVSAVRHSLDTDIAGIFNVAADGWMNEETLANLADRKVRIKVHPTTLRMINGVGWILGRASTPSTLLGHLLTPSMVSSASLRSTGWKPMHSNEEAFLTSSYPSWWGSLTARRRQDVSLGAFVAVIVASIGTVVASVRRAGSSERARRSDVSRRSP